MAVDVLCETVHDDVCALEEGGGVEGGEEGVVYEDVWVGGVRTSEGDDAGDVNEAEGGVCWSFYPDELITGELDACMRFFVERENLPWCFPGMQRV